MSFGTPKLNLGRLSGNFGFQGDEVLFHLTWTNKATSLNGSSLLHRDAVEKKELQSERRMKHEAEHSKKKSWCTNKGQHHRTGGQNT